MSDKLFIGIDGGASQTAGTLMDSKGNILARTKAGGSSVIGRPGNSSLAVLLCVVRSLLKESGVERKAIACVGIGLCGVDFEDEVQMQKRTIASTLAMPVKSVVLVNDGIVALWGATDAKTACILQHGSGVTAAWRKAYGKERLFDHLNSGKLFDMRWSALALVARMIDGRDEPSLLKNRILRHLGISSEAEYTEVIFRNRVPFVKWATVAPLVYELWLKDDPAAGSLVEQALDDYACAARAMVRKIGRDDVDAVFGGGVIVNAPQKFWGMLEKRMKKCCPAACVRSPALGPDIGAVLMAAHHEELDVRALYKQLQSRATSRKGD